MTSSGGPGDGIEGPDAAKPDALRIRKDAQTIPQISVTSPTSTLASPADGASTSPPDAASSSPPSEGNVAPSPSSAPLPSDSAEKAQREDETTYAGLEVVATGEEDRAGNYEYEESRRISHAPESRENAEKSSPSGAASQNVRHHQSPSVGQSAASSSPTPGNQVPLHTVDPPEKPTNIEPDEPPVYPSSNQQQERPQSQDQRQQHTPQRKGYHPPGPPSQQQQQQPQQHFDYVVPLHMLTATSLPVDCPICHKRGLTSIDFVSGGTTHVWAAILCFFTCLGCFMYLIDSVKDVQHHCSHCKVHLATWHRSGDVEVHVHGAHAYPRAPVAHPQQQHFHPQQPYPQAPPGSGHPGYQMRMHNNNSNAPPNSPPPQMHNASPPLPQQRQQQQHYPPSQNQYHHPQQRHQQHQQAQMGSSSLRSPPSTVISPVSQASSPPLQSLGFTSSPSPPAPTSQRI